MPPKRPPPPPQRANFAALRHYAHISHSLAHTRASAIPGISHDTITAENTAHDAKLTEAITEMRRKIMDEEMALPTLRQRLPTTPIPKLHQLRALKAAHDTGYREISYIPAAASSLNSLLAYRAIQRVIAQTVASLETVERHVGAARQQLREEDAAASEGRRLQEALQARVATLEGEGEEEEEEALDVGAAGAEELVREMGRRRKEAARRTGRLLKELLYLLEAGLARMLAAEEMGGPVVGDDLEVTLATGFDRKGRARKGERRIDEMWGAAEEDPEKRMAREFKDLLEELMNASLETPPYVELKKDSAAARFLVRAKVAVFHPKDARKLKLVDFGSNIED